jgi:hypothetical protein
MQEDRTDQPMILRCVRCGAEWPSNLLAPEHSGLCLLCDGRLEPVPVGPKPPR